MSPTHPGIIRVRPLLNGIILGVDPGTITGAALVSFQAGRPVAVLWHGVHTRQPGALTALDYWRQGVLLADWLTMPPTGVVSQASLVAVEHAVQNPRASSLMYGRQVAVIAVLRAELHRRAMVSTLEVHPKHSKLALTGSGSSGKPTMVAWALRRFPGLRDTLGRLTKSHREAVADAVAHALAGQSGQAAAQTRRGYQDRWARGRQRAWDHQEEDNQ